MRTVFTILLILTSACAGQSPSEPVERMVAEPAPNAQSRLWLESQGGSLRVMRSSGAAPEPRVMELWLKTSNVAAVTRSAPGDAVASAGKELTVQPKGDGLFRLIILSSDNTNGIGDGTLATLELARAADGPIRAELLTDRPMFAPQEAQQGLMVGDPIEL